MRDVDALNEQAARAVVRVISAAVRERGRCSLVLSGGSTPRGLYERLASTYRWDVPWSRVHVFWADERFVPAQSPGSNYHLARETMLDHVPCPAEHVHPMVTAYRTHEAAARAYEGTLREHCGGEPRLDLAILGLGVEGHTASIFPGSAAITEHERWVLAVRVPADPPVRLTLTLPVLAQSRAIFVLVSGASKASALCHVLTAPSVPDLYPAAGLLATAGALTWWVDEDAAGTAPETRETGASS